GPNGAGKTTTFYMIVGIETPNSGSVTLDGQDISHMPMYQRARAGIGYLPQEASIFSKMTVEDNIMAILETTGLDAEAREKKMNDLIEEFRLDHVRKSEGKALSGGERRRVEIARALATDPAFILLDEPFAGIDPIAVADIQSMIAHLTKRGIGILITDHNVRETLSIVDRAYILADGKILLQGDSNTIANDPIARKYYLGDNFSM
ncbi:MAG: LPS export ABC transporter ATP-binding protein, partial [Phascolarctobacterium sp.]